MQFLDGKVVVVTGAAHGLGRAYALHAAAAGAAVVVNDVDAAAATAVAAQIQADGGRAISSVRSVADAGGARDLVASAVREFGGLHGLVNNAGIRPEGSAWEEDPAEVRRAVEINLLGTLYCGIESMKVMRAAASGSIVNVSSRAQRGIPQSATYAATKGAIASLTYSWAIDLMPAGVRVNAIAPQATATGTRRKGAPPSDDEPRADQIAPLVTYLLSDLSSHVTGQVIRIGGRADALSIGLMTPPKNGIFMRSSAGWEVADLQVLFEETLDRRLEAVGAVPLPVASTLVNGKRVVVTQDDAL